MFDPYESLLKTIKPTSDWLATGTEWVCAEDPSGFRDKRSDELKAYMQKLAEQVQTLAQDPVLEKLPGQWILMDLSFFFMEIKGFQAPFDHFTLDFTQLHAPRPYVLRFLQVDLALKPEASAEPEPGTSAVEFSAR